MMKQKPLLLAALKGETPGTSKLEPRSNIVETVLVLFKKMAGLRGAEEPEGALRRRLREQPREFRHGVWTSPARAGQRT